MFPATVHCSGAVTGSFRAQVDKVQAAGSRGAVPLEMVQQMFSLVPSLDTTVTTPVVGSRV